MLVCGERAGMWGESGYGDGSTHYVWLSSITLLPCLVESCLAFLHWHFPWGSHPSHPLKPSFHGQQQPSFWDCSTIPKLQLPATAPSKRPAFRSQVCMAAARTVWFSSHLGCHRSAVSLSALNVSPLTQTIVPLWGSTLVSFPPPAEGRSSPTNTPVPPPFSFILPSFVWFYIFFSTGQVLLFPFSSVVLHALLCLKVYSWCIHGERFSPHLPTPLLSCSPLGLPF